ncbi:type II toxin-antitoxin system prevent-host-death family antitoxin [Nguyenibacter sp. L1]|uniref:type II toxin-antitoxin system prevent-host-death family antitoxin n=1 Tax=Nguyenibacter sp. L1 TaxID=3049350 RepID=UPI002B490FDB|nr:type II toxin-antitoxin system prevent-host-death family antitoxin [Nguyenibacter sp. L1]WRH89557.1 type II toxin-antitoxin system prevent-host-death family antitoxin [Nguyenibacter sp. L1]
MEVTSADFIKRYGELADRAVAEPVTITKNGRKRLVVLGFDEFQRLRELDRRAFRTEDLATVEPGLAKALEGSEMPSGYEHLDDEVKGWTP